MTFSRFLTASTLVFASVSVFAAPLKYTIDKDHSKIGFTVRHMMISDVAGNFKDFDGSFTFDADKDLVTDGKFEAKTASISTENAKRDEHLQSGDFFDAAKFPFRKINTNGRAISLCTAKLTRSHSISSTAEQSKILTETCAPVSKRPAH
jgi:polyisoprenoid-binding protein YceI